MRRRTHATTLSHKFAHAPEGTRAALGRMASCDLPSSRRLQWAIMVFKRITTDARQMGGVPCLRGLRVPVATVVSLAAEGQTEDVREALFFAAEDESFYPEAR